MGLAKVENKLLKERTEVQRRVMVFDDEQQGDPENIIDEIAQENHHRSQEPSVGLDTMGLGCMLTHVRTTTLLFARIR
jgi:hypothetical protein